MRPVRAEVVNEKAVDLRRVTIAGALAAQVGHAEPHEDVPDAADADISVVVRMTRCQNAGPHKFADDKTRTNAQGARQRGRVPPATCLGRRSRDFNISSKSNRLSCLSMSKKMPTYSGNDRAIW